MRVSSDKRTQERGTAPGTESAVATRIVNAARRHFLTHGFRGVTMDDLAAELGMSKKTLYACFASKTALLEAVLQQKFSEVNSDLEAIAGGDGRDFSATLHRMLACVQKHTGEIQPAFVRDIRKEAPELFGIVESKRRELIRRHFQTLFEQGRKAGLVRKDIPVRLIIEILLGATDAVMNPAKIEELGVTPKSGYSAIISIVLAGALNEKGRGIL